MRSAVWTIAGMAALLVAGTMKAEAAGGSTGGSTVKWASVELSMKPRVDDPTPAWTVQIRADGAGTYSESGSTMAGTIPLSISAATMERVRQGERAAKSGKCETKEKNIAKTGEKTIRYDVEGKVAECTFNFSDDQGLMGAMAAFQAIAETMRHGERLQHDLRYDRLGLDADIDLLVSAKQSGSAIELGNIAPVLQAMVQDERVIDRVRRKAARLLQDAGSPVPAGFDSSER